MVRKSWPNLAFYFSSCEVTKIRYWHILQLISFYMVLLSFLDTIGQKDTQKVTESECLWWESNSPLSLNKRCSTVHCEPKVSAMSFKCWIAAWSALVNTGRDRKGQSKGARDVIPQQPRHLQISQIIVFCNFSLIVVRVVRVVWVIVPRSSKHHASRIFDWYVSPTHVHGAAPVALSAQSLEGSRGRCSGAQEEDQAMTNGLQQDSGNTSIVTNNTCFTSSTNIYIYITSGWF